MWKLLKTICLTFVKFVFIFFVAVTLLVWFSDPEKEMDEALDQAHEETQNMLDSPIEYFTADTPANKESIIESHSTNNTEQSDQEELFFEAEYGEYVDERYPEEQLLSYEQRKYPYYSWNHFVRNSEMFLTVLGMGLMGKVDGGCITKMQVSAVMDNVESLYQEFVYIRLPQKVKYASDERQIDDAQAWFNREIEDLFYGYPPCLIEDVDDFSIDFGKKK